MSNDNETVEQLCDIVRGLGLCSTGDGSFETIVGERVYATLLAERILDAHNREIDALAAQKTAEAHEAFVKNAELAEAIAAKDAEIVRLRSLVEGLFAASAMECTDCRYDCGPNRENCIIHEASNYIKKVEVEND